VKHFNLKNYYKSFFNKNVEINLRKMRQTFLPLQTTNRRFT